ncbi:uncharacterized protein LOC108027887 isoform X2 [Drosophila biarmipes]|uniref:uncharacterized protein LOC108027887 isoform X2 n=1 Tax=Drosophila biarmipes TaxID=125945 RepID=UPI001CDAE9B7|nr:uncharacterized protein LOC108027887 isoform X2 [Drosophila biarmipes]
MGKLARFYSQNSNQPLNADFKLEEQMFPRLRSNYDFGRNWDSNRAYMRYMKTLVRVQSSIHKRFHNRSSGNSQAHLSRISAGGSAKNSDKSSQEPKANNQCCDQAKETDCPASNKPLESSGQSCDKSPKKSEKPEPIKASCCDKPESQHKCKVTFEKPVATEIPVFDPPFRNCPCTEPDERHLPIIGVCCDQEPLPEIQKTCTPQPAKEHKHEKTTERPRDPPARRCCSRPIIVVPAGEGTSRLRKPQTKVVTQDHSKSPPPSKQNQSKSQSLDKPHNPPPHSEKSSVEPQKTCPICNQNYPAHSKCQCSTKFETCPSVEKPQCSTNPPPCSNCPAITDISKQLCEMNRRLDGLQSQELCDIRSQVDSLNASVQSLASKCIEVPPPKNIERKVSSTCQFCRGQSLTQLDSFHCQLMDLIGDRCLTDIVISIFLRADNLYHVNVRDLSSGCSLGCFLVTDAAIEEAIQLGVFQDILTFSVIDVRNTIKPKSCPLGISFEFHHADRQSGGCDQKARGTCMVGTHRKKIREIQQALEQHHL